VLEISLRAELIVTLFSLSARKRFERRIEEDLRERSLDGEQQEEKESIEIAVEIRRRGG